MTTNDGNAQNCPATDDEAGIDASAPTNSKRSLLKAVWAAPLIVSISLPRSGYASNISRGRAYGKAKQNGAVRPGKPK